MSTTTTASQLLPPHSQHLRQAHSATLTSPAGGSGTAQPAHHYHYRSGEQQAMISLPVLHRDTSTVTLVLDPEFFELNHQLGSNPAEWNPEIVRVLRPENMPNVRLFALPGTRQQAMPQVVAAQFDVAHYDAVSATRLLQARLADWLDEFAARPHHLLSSASSTSAPYERRTARSSARSAVASARDPLSRATYVPATPVNGVGNLVSNSAAGKRGSLAPAYSLHGVNAASSSVLTTSSDLRGTTGPTLFALLARLGDTTVTTPEQRQAVRRIITDYLNNDISHGKVFSYLGQVIGYQTLDSIIRGLCSSNPLDPRQQSEAGAHMVNSYRLNQPIPSAASSPPPVLNAESDISGTSWSSATRVDSLSGFSLRQQMELFIKSCVKPLRWLRPVGAPEMQYLRLTGGEKLTVLDGRAFVLGGKPRSATAKPPLPANLENRFTRARWDYSCHFWDTQEAVGMEEIEGDGVEDSASTSGDIGKNGPESSCDSQSDTSPPQPTFQTLRVIGLRDLSLQTKSTRGLDWCPPSLIYHVSHLGSFASGPMIVVHGGACCAQNLEQDECVYLNDRLYGLDIFSKRWLSLEREDDGEPIIRPAARHGHASAMVPNATDDTVTSNVTAAAYAEYLIVFGGVGTSGQNERRPRDETNNARNQQRQYSRCVRVHRDDLVCLNDLWIFNFLTGLWSQVEISSCPRPRFGASFLWATSSSLLLVGGESRDYITDCDAACQSTESCLKEKDLCFSPRKGNVALLNDCWALYLVPCTSEIDLTDNNSSPTIPSMTWERVPAELDAPRAHYAAVALTACIGGVDGQGSATFHLSKPKWSCALPSSLEDIRSKGYLTSRVFFIISGTTRNADGHIFETPSIAVGILNGLSDSSAGATLIWKTVQEVPTASGQLGEGFSGRRNHCAVYFDALARLPSETLIQEDLKQHVLKFKHKGRTCVKKNHKTTVSSSSLASTAAKTTTMEGDNVVLFPHGEKNAVLPHTDHETNGGSEKSCIKAGQNEKSAEVNTAFASEKADDDDTGVSVDEDCEDENSGDEEDVDDFLLPEMVHGPVRRSNTKASSLLRGYNGCPTSVPCLLVCGGLTRTGVVRNDVWVLRLSHFMPRFASPSTEGTFDKSWISGLLLASNIETVPDLIPRLSGAGDSSGPVIDSQMDRQYRNQTQYDAVPVLKFPKIGRMDANWSRHRIKDLKMMVKAAWTDPTQNYQPLLFQSGTSVSGGLVWCLATTVRNPLSSFGFLVENAAEKHVKASHVHVSIGSWRGVDAITVEDNGVGLTHRAMHTLLKRFGCRTEDLFSKDPSRFGLGFKLAVSRLAHNCLVLTKTHMAYGVGLFSAPLNAFFGTSSFSCPIVFWAASSGFPVVLPLEEAEFGQHVSLIVSNSPLQTTRALVHEFEAFGNGTGTRFIFFGLRKDLPYPMITPSGRVLCTSFRQSWLLQIPSSQLSFPRGGESMEVSIDPRSTDVQAESVEGTESLKTSSDRRGNKKRFSPQTPNILINSAQPRIHNTLPTVVVQPTFPFYTSAKDSLDYNLATYLYWLHLHSDQSVCLNGVELRPQCETRTEKGQSIQNAQNEACDYGNVSNSITCNSEGVERDTEENQAHQSESEKALGDGSLTKPLQSLRACGIELPKDDRYKHSLWRFLQGRLHHKLEFPFLFRPEYGDDNFYGMIGFLNKPGLNACDTTASSRVCEAGVLLYYKGRLISRPIIPFPAVPELFSTHIPQNGDAIGREQILTSFCFTAVINVPDFLLPRCTKEGFLSDGDLAFHDFYDQLETAFLEYLEVHNDVEALNALQDRYIQEFDAYREKRWNQRSSRSNLRRITAELGREWYNGTSRSVSVAPRAVESGEMPSHKRGAGSGTWRDDSQQQGAMTSSGVSSSGGGAGRKRRQPVVRDDVQHQASASSGTDASSNQASCLSQEEMDGGRDSVSAQQNGASGEPLTSGVSTRGGRSKRRKAETRYSAYVSHSSHSA